MSEVKHYGNTVAEKKLSKIQTCRDIVRVIIDYGVDQQQLLTIIRLLALELEDHEQMVQITEMIKEFDNAPLFIDTEEKK